MRELEEKIIQEGKLLGTDIINVGSFLNHQIDTILLKKMAKEVKRLFKEPITKILTIEASGIAFACAVAMEYNVPFVFAKKSKTSNIDGEMAISKVYSFTHQKENCIYVPKSYIKSTDQVLIVDDFLANGEALKGLIDITNMCGATLVGCVVQIEKVYQNGGNNLRAKGYKVEALASIKEITDKIIKY